MSLEKKTMKILGVDNSIENLQINKYNQHCACKVVLSEEMQKAIENYECLSIGFSRGVWNDLSFLCNLSPKLQRLRVQSENIDWKSICQLSELRQLRLDSTIKDKVDFNKLTGLKSLEYYWDKKNVGSVLSHPGIENLIIYGAKNLDFSVFENMTSLKRLEIIRGDFVSLDGVENIQNLKSLRLNSMTKLEDISALGLLENLIHLSFASCNKVNLNQNYSSLFSLLELSILKQKNVDSLELLSTIPKLEILKILETTIKGGNLDFLYKMPYLKALRIDSKKHYDIDVESFSKNIKAKYGDYELDIFNILGIDFF